MWQIRAWGMAKKLVEVTCVLLWLQIGGAGCGESRLQETGAGGEGAVELSDRGQVQDKGDRPHRKKTHRALHSASLIGDAKAVRWLIEAGADVNALDDDGDAPLHFAYTAEVAKLLIAAGADIEKPGLHDHTPLLSAAGGGRAEVVALLIRNGARLAPEGPRGLKALHSAIISGDVTTVRVVLDAGADVNDVQGSSPLEYAVEFGNADVAALLVKRGADLNARGYHGMTPAHTAILAQHWATARRLVALGAKRDIFVAAGLGLVRDTKSLLDGTPRLATARAFKSRSTPLHWARDAATARLLLEHGAELEARNADGETPLHRAARDGRGAVAKALIEAGAEPNAADHAGQTPLHEASQGGQLEVAKMLLEHGAKVNAKSKFDHTPLHLSVFGKHLGVVRWLVAQGADVKARNQDGKTALDLAEQYAVDQIARYLTEVIDTAGSPGQPKEKSTLGP